MVMLLVTVTVALGISFLCSVLEAALFTVRPTELAERAKAGDKAAATLRTIKTKRLDDAISSILILNTIAHTIGAAMAGAQAADLFGDAWVGVFSAVLTLMVLVLTEIIPKTFGATYASQLVPFVARTLSILEKVMLPALLLTRGITRLIGNAEHGKISRGEVKAMVEHATKEGLLGEDESRIVGNALRLGHVSIEAVMTPRGVVYRLPASTTVAAVLDEISSVPYTRIPIYDEGEEDIIGYVRLPEIYRAGHQGRGQATLREMMRPMAAFEEQDTVGEALRRLIRSDSHIAIVRDGFGGLAGVVTLEDLLETLVGAEIVDESDSVPDLRALALELRAKRLGKRTPAPSSKVAASRTSETKPATKPTPPPSRPDTPAT